MLLSRRLPTMRLSSRKRQTWSLHNPSSMNTLSN
jgi:hypothetical protein